MTMSYLFCAFLCLLGPFSYCFPADLPWAEALGYRPRDKSGKCCSGGSGKFNSARKPQSNTIAVANAKGIA